MQLHRDSFATGRNGADGIRTHDPLVANQVLSQLSYRPLLNTNQGLRWETDSEQEDAQPPSRWVDA